MIAEHRRVERAAWPADVRRVLGAPVLTHRSARSVASTFSLLLATLPT
jgi:hypothetical protein